MELVPEVEPDCPNNFANKSEDPARQVTIHDDNSIVYSVDGRCGLGAAKAVGENYEKVLHSVSQCEGPEFHRVPASGILGKLGLKKEVVAECPALLRHFDPSSRRQITDFFEG